MYIVCVLVFILYPCWAYEYQKFCRMLEHFCILHQDTPFCLLSTCPGFVFPDPVMCSNDILQSLFSMTSVHDNLNQFFRPRVHPLPKDGLIRNRKLLLNPVLLVFEDHWATLSPTLWLLRRDELWSQLCRVLLWELCCVPLDAFKILALSGFSKHKCASWWQGWRWEGWGREFVGFPCLDHLGCVNLLEREPGLWLLFSWQLQKYKLELASVQRVSPHGSYALRHRLPLARLSRFEHDFFWELVKRSLVKTT